MTIEEAIVVLKCAMPNSSIRCVVSDDEKEEAITMAIEALEREENPNSIRINFVGEKEAKEFNEYLKNQQESVFDKIKAEIDTQDKWLAQAGYNAYNVDIAFNSIKRVVAESEDKNDTSAVNRDS